MFHSMRLPISLAAVAALSTGVAFAADYDPPIYIEEAPQFVPVEIGSGWYIRGDLSYNLARPVYNFSLLGERVTNDRLGGGVGFGYHFTDNFRADATVSYLGRDRFAVDVPPDSATISHSAWSGLVSGYYDIATVMGLTPYVGAGVGLTYSRHRANLAGPGLAGAPLAWSRDSYDFSYALMAGASYKVTDNASVDVGYQFLHTPGMRYYDVGTDTFRRGAKHHLVKVGLRYDLW